MRRRSDPRVDAFVIVDADGLYVAVNTIVRRRGGRRDEYITDRRRVESLSAAKFYRTKGAALSEKLPTESVRLVSLVGGLRETTVEE